MMTTALVKTGRRLLRPRAFVPLTVAWWLALATAGGSFAPSIAHCEQPLGDAPAPASTEIAGGITVGITGHYRIGCWTAVRLPEGSDEAPTAGELWIETVDGEGTRTVYRQATTPASGKHGYCVPGGEAVPLIIGSDAGPVVRTRFPERGVPALGPSMIPLEMPWVVALGDPLGIETVGANELLGRPAQVAVSRPRRAEDLPASHLGYSGVDLMVINDAGREVLGELGPEQVDAIVTWVQGGGRLLLGLGESTPQLFATAPWLARLLPIASGELAVEAMDPSGFETYMSSQTQLGRFTGAVLPTAEGRVLVSGRTARRQAVALAAQYVTGLGRVTAVAADLHQGPMMLWPERLNLILRLTGNTLTGDEEDGFRAVNRATAYDDLAGQARATLDRFASGRRFGFSVITLIVLALIALVGPLDYLLVNRVAGRPLLGWVTFPAVAIAISAWLVYESRAVPAEKADVAGALQCNRLEVVDIDAVEGTGRGFSWSYLYSHPARRIDVRVQPSEALEAGAGRFASFVTAPFGWPGRSFGGIQIAGEDTRMPAYEIQVERTGQGSAESGEGQAEDEPDDDEAARFEIAAHLQQLPLAPRSSKSIGTHYRFEFPLDEVTPVQLRRGSELLQGGLTNPLPFDLFDALLVYQDWVYVLPTRFPVGARVASLNQLRQKNFRWQLTRQKAIEQATEGEEWDPAAADDPLRMVEMLMFHRAAGGERFTSLRHQPLGFLDLSELLTEDRCVLIGRLAEPLTEIEAVAAEDSPRSAGGPEIPAGQSTAMVRVVLPVEPAARRR